MLGVKEVKLLTKVDLMHFLCKYSIGPSNVKSEEDFPIELKVFTTEGVYIFTAGSTEYIYEEYQI